MTDNEICLRPEGSDDVPVDMDQLTRRRTIKLGAFSISAILAGLFGRTKLAEAGYLTVYSSAAPVNVRSAPSLSAPVVFTTNCGYVVGIFEGTVQGDYFMGCRGISSNAYVWNKVTNLGRGGGYVHRNVSIVQSQGWTYIGPCC